MRRRTQWLLLVLPPVLLLAVAGLVFQWVHISVPQRLSADERARVVGVLRAAVDGKEPSAQPSKMKLPDQGPLVVGFWVNGREVARVEGRGKDLRSATKDAAKQLKDNARLRRQLPAMRQSGRLQVDLVVGRGPFPESSDFIKSISLHPGLEGFGVTLPDREVLLLPHDLTRRRLVSSKAPMKLIEFKMGFDFKRADRVMAHQSKLSVAKYEASPREHFRFRTDSFVERAVSQRDQAPIALVRGVPVQRPDMTAETLREAAMAGARFLVAHLADNGRYIYEANLVTGTSTDPKRPGPYSIPRHAGTTYFLAELYRITGEAFLREPIERAFAHLSKLLESGGCGGKTEEGALYACVVDRGQKVAELGSTALAVVALVEYWRATKDTRYQPLAGLLSEWILLMQRDDGSFAHRFDVPKKQRDEKTQLLYYSGEAALALARMHKMTGEARYAKAAERALDHLVGTYDFFLAGFFYGEEHWTCIAAEAILPTVKKDSYNEFCRGYGAFLRSHQLEAGDFPTQDDLAGSYLFTPFAMPANTPAGSRSEAMISAYLLSKAHGEPDEEIRKQVLAALSYVLGQQVREESTVWAAQKAKPFGGIPANPTEMVVRIDYVQHVCSALIRAIELIEPSN